jgi:DNA-directed RNA polymerase subunit F
MAEEILSKEPIPIPMLNSFLKEIKKEKRSEIHEKLLAYVKNTAKLSEADCQKALQELKELNIPCFTTDLAVSLLNIMPLTLTEIRTVLAGKININPENFKKIQEILLKYVK